MAKNTNEPQLYWFSNFLGILQRQAWDQIPPNMLIMCKNIAMDKPGALKKRKGADLLSTTQAGNGVYGLIEYKNNAGTGKVRAIRSTDLDEYTVGTDTWAATDAAQFTASTKIQSTNFLNKVFHISTSDNLCYESGGACTDVVDGSSGKVRGNSIAVAQNTLFVGGITYLGAGAVSYQDRVYYSRYDETNNTPTDDLFDSGDSYTDSTRWFTLNGPCKGLFPFGTSNLIYAFTDKACYKFDIALENNRYGIQKVFDIGLANPRAITQTNGYMVWMDPTGRIWAYDGKYGAPMNLSWTIENDNAKESIVGLISTSQLDDVCAGTIGNTFHFSIGSITYFGETITNAVLKGLVSQNWKNVFWGVDAYPVKPAIFANAKISGEEVLLFGANGVDDVYRMYANQYVDGSTAIDAWFRTMFTDCDDLLMTKSADALWIKFRPQSADNTYLKARYAVNSNYSYTTLTDPDNGTPVVKYGKLDMYSSDYATNTDKILPINIPNGVKFRTMSLELGNAQANEGFEITGVGIKFSKEPLDIRPEYL